MCALDRDVGVGRYACRVQSRAKRRNWRDPRAIAQLEQVCIANEIIIKLSSLVAFALRCVASALQPWRMRAHMHTYTLTHTHTHINCERWPAGNTENEKKVSFPGPTWRCRWLPRSRTTQLLRALRSLLYTLGKRNGELALAGVISDFPHPLPPPPPLALGQSSLRCPRRKQAGQTARTHVGHLRGSEG